MMKNIIVIGGGILGAATAYKLAKIGADVTVIDAAKAGQATDAGAGIVCPWVSKRRNPHWYALAKGGARMYPELIRELEADGIEETGYAQVGSLSLQEDQHKLEELYELISERREEAPEIGEVKLLDEAETQKRFPLIPGGFGAVYVSGGARVDGRLLRDALLQGAARHGMKQIRGDAELITAGGKVLGIGTADGELEADTVIAVNGAWMRDLLDPLLAESGRYFDVRPQRAQIVHLSLDDERAGEWPVANSPFNQYMLAVNGRLIVGATQENHTGFDCRQTAGGMHEILHKALELAPTLSDATILETRVGFRPMTPESVPVIGPFPGISGLFAANGLGSSGLTMAPFMADQLAKLALGEPLEIELEGYALDKIIKKIKK